MRKTRNTNIRNKRNAGVELDRTEKVSSGDKKKDQVDEISSTENKKMTTVPLKKRPLPIKKIVDRKPISKEVLTPTIAAGRSKRTPKPNPKYSNETMVTSRLRSKKSKYESSEEEDLVDEDEISEPSTDQEENNSDDTFNEFDNEDDDGDVDFMEKIPVNRKSTNMSQKRTRVFSPTRITTSTPLGRPGILRGRPKRSPNPLEKIKYSTSGQPNKRNVDYEKKKQKVESSIIERNKRLNIELYDSSGKEGMKGQQNSTKEFNIQQVRQISSRIRPKAVTPDPVSIGSSSSSKRNMDAISKRVGKPITAIQRGMQSKKDDRSNNAKTSTQDDFETMPTFTIVNVNDIMNNREILVTDSKSVTRRKERPISILSESSDEEQLPARKPFPPKRSSNFLNNNNLSKMDSKKGEKAAPIILNSLLGNNVAQVSPKINKNIINSNIRDIKTHRSTLNFKSGYRPQMKHPIPSSQRVVIEREGDQLVKKITCFESWYIIDIPEEEPPPPPKNVLDISLVEIGNAAKEILLPSNNWKHKVTLQQIPENILVRGDYEEYTGDLEDLSISEDDRDKYQPTSVMFKRAASEKEKARLPYDRAVIFKNKTFFTNIDGKNIRLIGAPNNISSLEDVEILIQLVDELPLDSQFVEPTTTI